jgi:hypothetical protein
VGVLSTIGKKLFTSYGNRSNRSYQTFFAEKKKVPKKKLSAVPDSVKVSGLAWSVLPEPANAEFEVICGLWFFSFRQQFSFG